MRILFVEFTLIVSLLCISVIQSQNTWHGSVTGETTTTAWDEGESSEEEVTTAQVSVRKKKFSIKTNTVLYAMAVALVISGCVVSFILWLLSRRARARILADEESMGPSPQKMDSEPIILSEFKDRGPLVMQARMKGKIKHALDDDKSFSLKEIQFDTKHNEICIIGSDIEQLEGMSQLSLLSGEKSQEPIKPPTKKGGYPTMATELKKQEAERERVRENERRIAESALRRRAKEQAAAARGKDEGARSQKSVVGSHPTSDRSQMSRVGETKGSTSSPNARSPMPHEELTDDKTQYSMKSVASGRGRRRRDAEKSSRSPPHHSPYHSSRNNKTQYSMKSMASGRGGRRRDAEKSLQSPPHLSPYHSSRNNADSLRKSSRKVTARRRPSNDGRSPDGLGAKIRRKPSATKSSMAATGSDDSHSQKSRSQSISSPDARSGSGQATVNAKARTRHSETEYF